jgi:hypothetical protein
MLAIVAMMGNLVFRLDESAMGAIVAIHRKMGDAARGSLTMIESESWRCDRQGGESHTSATQIGKNHNRRISWTRDD